MRRGVNNPGSACYAIAGAQALATVRGASTDPTLRTLLSDSSPLSHNFAETLRDLAPSFRGSVSQEDCAEYLAELTHATGLQPQTWGNRFVVKKVCECGHKWQSAEVTDLVRVAPRQGTTADLLGHEIEIVKDVECPGCKQRREATFTSLWQLKSDVMIMEVKRGQQALDDEKVRVG